MTSVLQLHSALGTCQLTPPYPYLKFSGLANNLAHTCFNIITMKVNHSHTDKKVTFECGKCGITFSGNKSLSRHRITIHNDLIPKQEMHNCELCSEAFSRRDALNKHKKLIHVHEAPMFGCDANSLIDKILAINVSYVAESSHRNFGNA